MAQHLNYVSAFFSADAYLERITAERESRKQGGSQALAAV